MSMSFRRLQKESNTSFAEGLVDICPDGLIAVSLEGKILSWNRGAETLFGYTAEEAVGEPIHDLVIPEERRAEARLDLDEVLESGSTRIEAVWRHKNGTLIHVDVSMGRIGAPGANPYIAVCERDITQLKRLQDERASEISFRGLLEVVPDAMVIVGQDGLIRLLNIQLEKLFGYQREELVGQPIDILVPPRFRSQHSQHRLQYFGDPRARSMGAGLDLHAIRKDGTEFPVEISLAPVETPKGRLITATIRDITKRQKIEEKFRGLLEAAPDAVVIANHEGAIVLVNSLTKKLFGYPRIELVGKKVELLIPSRFRDGHPQHSSGYFGDSTPRSVGSNFELCGMRKDGSEFPIEISLSPLESAEGQLVWGAIRDLTVRKSAEEMKFELAAIVDSSEDAVIGKSLEGIVRTWNHGAQRIFGYSPEEMIGQTLSRLLPPGRDAEEPAILARIARGERVEPFETVRRRKNGQDFWVSVTISPIRDSRGRVTGASKVARDITDRKRAEQQLLKAKEAAETANREREAFSYSVADDLS